MPADPIVSPADTIRRALDAFQGGGTMRQAAEDALDALLAVGERDKAERDRQQKRAERAEQVLREQVAENRTLVVAGERDRRQIARLTAEVERLLDCRGATNGTVSKRGGEPAVCRECAESARAVLAGEEDAGDEA